MTAANKTKSPFLNRHIWSIVLILLSSGAKLLSEFLPDFTNFSEATTQKWVHFFDQIFVAIGALDIQIDIQIHFG